MKQFFRNGLERLSPRAFITLTAARSRAHSQGLLRAWGLRALNQRLIAEIGNAVIAGPFEGLLIPEIAQAEHLGPFLLGTYETELHAWWHGLLREQFAQMLDVGSKFGFYAVAYAKRFPSAEVVAFDPDPWARRASRAMAEINHTPNVRIEGLCDPEWLRRKLRPNAFIMSDCEGYEKHLFCSRRIPALSSATMLIELHDAQAPGVTTSIQAAFRETHTTTLVPSAPEALPTVKPVGALTAEDMLQLSREIRGPQAWILLRPRLCAELSGLRSVESSDASPRR